MRRFAFCLALSLAAPACGGQSSRNEPVDANAGSGGAPSGTGGSAGGRAGRAGAGGTTGGDAVGGNGAAPSGGAKATGGAGASGNGAGGSSSGAGGMPANAGNGGEAAAGGEPVAVLIPCDASAQTGCESGSFCQNYTNGCDPATEASCEGYCATRLERNCSGNDYFCPEGYACVPLPGVEEDPSRTTCVEEFLYCETACPPGFQCVEKDGLGYCSPERAHCGPPITCTDVPSPCAPGFIHSTLYECYGPCVRVEHCACNDDFDCGAPPAICDRSTGTCAIPKAPAPRCLVPVAAPTCGNPSGTYFSFIDGRCQSVTGVRCDEANQFLTFEECETFCEGKPIEEPCAEGFAHATVCLSCGPLGGCGAMREICARTCTADADCPVREGACVDGVCSIVGCL